MPQQTSVETQYFIDIDKGSSVDVTLESVGRYFKDKFQLICYSCGGLFYLFF